MSIVGKFGCLRGGFEPPTHGFSIRIPPSSYFAITLNSSIHILCNREGLINIPGHEKTADLSTKIAFNWGKRRYEYYIIPDSLFAIKYQKGYIAYLVEADRNTVPNDPVTPHRKSARRSIKQYAEFIGKKLYKKRFGLNCPLVVINISVSEAHIESLLKIGQCSYLAFGTAEEFKTPFKVPSNLLIKDNKPLSRNHSDPFEIF